MKQFFTWLGKHIAGAMVFSLFSILFISFIVYAINYPSAPPTGEVAGGKFMQYFTNIKWISDCPEWNAIIWFNADFTKKCAPIITTPIPSLSGSQEFSTNGTFTVPSGVTSINISAIGGGGGGGGLGYQYGSNLVWYGDWGSAGTEKNVSIPVTPGETLGISTGAGGLGGLATGSWSANPAPSGSPGGNTLISRAWTNLVVAAGGAGGGIGRYGEECSTAASVSYVGGSGTDNWLGTGGGIGTHTNLSASATSNGAGGAGGNYYGVTCYQGNGAGSQHAWSGGAGYIKITW